MAQTQDTTSAIKDATQQAATDFAKKAGKEWAKKALLPLLPYLAVGAAIAILGIAIYSLFAQNGISGTTAPRLTNPNSATDRRVVLETDANAGNKSAAVQLAGETAAEILATQAQQLLDATNRSGDEKKIGVAQAAFDTINTVGSGNIAADIRNVRSLISTLDPEDALSSDGPLAQLEKDTSTPAVASTAAALKNALQYLYETLISVENPKLIINERDKLAIRNNEIDIRVLKTLNYLVRPTAYGGAGHQKIKVLRIKHTYENENDQYSYEWGEDMGQTEKISPHARGQAMDISVVDYVKRGLFRKSIAKGKKRKPQSSKDILVAMQSNDPGKSRRVPGAESDGDTFMDMFENAAMDKLLTQIEENTGYDLSAAKKTTGNLGVIAQNVGLVIASQELDLPIDVSQDNSSLEKLSQNIGRNYGARCLALPYDSLRGLTSSELRQSIGQSMIEQRLGVIPRSLTGTTRDEILSSMGRRKIESVFKLRPMSLQYIKSGDSFNTFVGQIILEQTLGLPGGSFYTNDLATIKSSIGADTFDSAFGATDSSLETGDKSDKIDQLLGLDKLTRYTYLMKKGGLSVLAYKNAIGNSYLNAYINNFKTYQTVIPRIETTEASRGTQGAVTTIYVPSGTDNQSDEAINVPDGSLSRLLAADYNTFIDIGKDELVKKLTSDDDERTVITTWLNAYIQKGRLLDDVGFLHAVTLDDGMGGVFSERLPTLHIKTREEIENKDIEKIASLKQQLDAQKLLLLLQKTPTNTRGQDGQKSTLERTKIEENIRALEGELRATEADIAQWSFISLAELEKNFALPSGTLSALLMQDDEAIKNIFKDVGKIRATTKIARAPQVKNQDTKLEELAEEYSTLLFEKEQLATYIELLSSTQPTSLELPRAKNNLVEVEERIRTIEAEQGTDADMLDPLGDTNLFRDSLGLCNDDFFADILIGDDETTVNERFTQIGMKKLEKTLNLPSDVLTLAMDKIQNRQEPKPSVNNKEVGRDYLENALDPNSYFAPGWMRGDTIDDVINNITRSVAINKPAKNIFDFSASEAANEYFLSLFGIAKGKNLAQVRNELRDQASQSYQATTNTDTKIAQHIRSIINNPQESIRIDAGTSARFLLGTTSPDQFAEAIGSNYNSHPSIQGYVAKSEKNRDPRDEVKKRLSASDIGQRAIESIIDPKNTLGAGWFTGKSLRDTVLVIAQRLKAQPRHIFEVLPIKDSERLLVRGFGINESSSLVRLSDISSSSTGNDYIAYQAMAAFDDTLNKKLKTAVNKIGIAPNTTYKLFAGELSPEAYATEIGEAYLQNKSAQFISDSIKTTDGDALVTKRDVVSILNGSYIDTAISIGSRAIDDGLVVPAGTVKALIDNPSLSCQVTISEDEAGLSRTQSCIENILSANGKQKLAQFAGIVGNINQSSNTREYVGQTQAEQTLYNPIAGPNQTEQQRRVAQFIQRIASRDSLVQGGLPAGWLKGQDLYEVRRNTAKLLYPNLVGVIDKEKENTDKILGRPILANAEAIVLAMLGFIPTENQEDNYYSIRALEIGNWNDPTTNLAATAQSTDDVLHIEHGSTQALFTRSISLAEYKKRIADYHTAYTIGNNTCNALDKDARTKGSRTEKILAVLEKHSLDCATLVDGIRDPEKLKNTALINALSPRDLGIVLGFSSYFDLKIPIKGGFTDNFAQRQIEETLGLPDGSFNPDASIENIMQQAGPSRFTRAFRIAMPAKSLSNEEIAQYLHTHVFVAKDRFRPSSYTDTYYFASAVNLKNTSVVDAILKLNNVPGRTTSATMSLMTGEITPGDYIQLVKENQLKAIDPISFAQFVVNGKTDGATVEKAKYLAGFIQQYTSAGAKPTSAQTYDAYLAMSELTHYDVDDKLDLVPGTVGNIILHPDHAKSIIISQGIREVSQQLLGPKNDITNPEKINFYNDLGFLMQYSVPQFKSQYAATLLERNPSRGNFIAETNPQGDPNACQPPTVPTYVPHPGERPSFTAAFGPEGGTELQKKYIQDSKLYATQLNEHNEYLRTQSEYSSSAYTKTKRSLCQDFVAKSFIGQTVFSLTTVKDKDDRQTFEGIRLKPYQTEALLKGDPKIFTAVGLAFSVNQLNARRDDSGALAKVLPPQFQVSYQDMYDATIGNATERNKAAFLASIEFEKARQQIPDEQEDPEAYRAYQNSLLEERPGLIFTASAEFRAMNPKIPDPKENPEGYDIYRTQMLRYATEKSKSRPQLGTPEYDRYVIDRKTYIAQKESQVKVDARKNIQYKYLDAQLSVVAENQNLPTIPAGFTKAVFGGSTKERNNALVSYGLSYLIQSPEFRDSAVGKNPVVAGTLSALLSSNNPNRFELANIEDQARGQLGSLIDSKLGGILEKNNIPASLLPPNFSTEMSRVLRGESPKFNQDAVRGALLSFADKRFGLPSGTSKAAYDLGQKISSGAQVKNADIAQVALVVFSKQLTKLDAQIGLPPGSLSAIISAVITPTPISIAVAVLTIVFGYSKVEMQMLCPPTDGSITQKLSPEEIAAIPYDAHRYWCKESSDSYRVWAQHNTRRLIEDLARSGERTRDTGLIPPLIGTFRKEDVDYFNGVSEDGSYSAQNDLMTIIHGINPITRGIKGIYQSDYMREYVHVSY